MSLGGYNFLPMIDRFEQRIIQLILLIFLILGVMYALVTPAFEASDELWHYPMIRHLADGNPLPVQVYDPALAGPWKQEASQPPLYYYVGAALTFWIDTADMETVRWLNPHVDNGVITADGNINLAVHDPSFNPWQGTLLAIRIVRLASVVMGAGTVVLTYLIGKEFFPNRPEIALGAAAANAFTPMFLFISGAVNNDNLAIPLASLGVLLLIRLVTRWPDQPRPVWAVVRIGIVIGLAVLTKQGTIGLIPLAFGTFVIWEWVRSRQVPLTYGRLLQVLARAAADFALLFVPIVLIAGWWYWRNIELYGDLLGWSAFIAVLGERETAASIAQLWDERWGFMLAYWGLFGGVNVPMWTWSYLFLNGLVVLALPGGLLLAIQQFRQGNQAVQKSAHNPAILRFISWLFDLVANRFAAVVCTLFSVAIIYGLVQWATTTWSSQGRLVFTGISTLSVLWIGGLAAWLPQKIANVVVAVPVGVLLFLAAVSPVLFIRPAYQPQIERVSDPGTAGCTLEHCLDPDLGQFDDKLRLAGFEVDLPAARPGERATIWLEWVALAPMEENWSIFVHLNDPALGVPIAQRDMYLGQGLIGTTFMVPGDRVVNQYAVQIPETVVTPAELSLMVGVYQFEAGERLPLLDGRETIELQTVPLQAAADENPNPVAVNFENQFELVGFELSPRRLTAGNEVGLTTYWRLLGQTDIDFTFFAQVVGEDTTRWAAADLGQPTSQWSADQIYPVEMVLAMDPGTPAEIYPIRIGIYQFTEENGFDNLQRVTAEGRLTDDFLNLTMVRVD